MTDIRCPRCSAWSDEDRAASTRELRGDSIPIIIMSTVDSDEFKTKCGDAGATDYLKVSPVRKHVRDGGAAAGTCSDASTSAATGSEADRGLCRARRGLH